MTYHHMSYRVTRIYVMLCYIISERQPARVPLEVLLEGFVLPWPTANDNITMMLVGIAYHNMYVCIDVYIYIYTHTRVYIYIYYTYIDR